MSPAQSSSPTELDPTELDPPELQPAVPPDSYEGPATISTPGGQVEVDITLRSYFDPIDGHSHWFARIGPNNDLARACSSGDTVAITVGKAGAQGRLSDLDPWGRFRITGTGRAPLPAEPDQARVSGSTR